MTTIVLSTLFVIIATLAGCGQTNSSSSKNIAASSHVRIKTCKEPGCVETADLNHDNLTDLIVTSQVDSSVTILLGKGKAEFQEVSGSPFFAGPNVNDVTPGDFDNDGNIDLAFANHERKFLTVLLGNGNGNFATAPNSPFPVRSIPHTHGIATGDFNGDGRLDLVTDSWGNNEVEVLFGDSTNLFRTPGIFLKVGRQPYQRLRTGDVNKDGKSDIVTTNLEGNNATILLSDGKGNFTEPPESPFSCSDSPFGLAIGDINADGNPDLAIVNSPSSTANPRGKNGMTILSGDGSGKFTKKNDIPYEAGNIPNRIAIGDVNGDEINDIVVSDNDGDKVYLFLMATDAIVSSSSSIGVGNHPKGITILDLNDDGKGDIVVCNTGDDDLSIILSK